MTAPEHFEFPPCEDNDEVTRNARLSRFYALIETRDRFPLLLRQCIDVSCEPFVHNILITLNLVDVDANENVVGRFDNEEERGGKDGESMRTSFNEDKYNEDDPSHKLEKFYSIIVNRTHLSGLQRESLEEAMQQMIQGVMYRVEDAVNYFYFESRPDASQDTEDEVETTVRFFTQALNVFTAGSTCNGPLFYLCKDVRSVSFLPLLARLMIEHRNLQNHREELNMLNFDIDNQKNILQYLAMHRPLTWKQRVFASEDTENTSSSTYDDDGDDDGDDDSDGMDFGLEYESQDDDDSLVEPKNLENFNRLIAERKLEVLKRFRAMNLFLPKDIETYELLHHICRDSCFCYCRFRYLVTMNPKGLAKAGETRGNLPLHEVALSQPLDVFRVVLEAGLEYFPDKFGFLFHVNQCGWTPYAYACQSYGREVVKNEVLENVWKQRKQLSSKNLSSLVVSFVSDPKVHFDGVYNVLRENPSIMNGVV